jgi:hypothetical protein
MEIESNRPPAASSPEDGYHLIGRRDEQAGRRIHLTALALAIGSGLYFAAKAEVDDPAHLFLGLGIYALSLWPFLDWLRQGGSRFPVFEPMMALCANAYALPLLNGHKFLSAYPASSVTFAGVAVLAYQAAAIAAYRLTRGRPAAGRFWRDSIFSRKVESFVSHGLLLSTVYMGLSLFTTVVPPDLESILRAVFQGIGILCTFVVAQRWARAELSQGERWFFGALFVLQLVFQGTILMLIGVMSLVGIATLGYMSAGNKLPLIPLLAVFVILAVLHNGKTAMRDIYWTEDGRARPALGEVPAFYLQWLEQGLRPPPEEQEARQLSAGTRLLDRASLMHMLTMVVHYTPERQPYLGGETYGYVLPQLIPRFFWADKPRSHVATYRLAVYYGLQSEDATANTTIAFGMPTEAYANFGLLGMAGLGVFFGFCLKKLQVLSARSPMFSLAGITMILLTAWSLNAEFTMAVWISSLYQALIVALGAPLLLRGLLDG